MPITVKEVPDQLPSEITSLFQMFNRSESFNQNIPSWDTSNVTNMDVMFYGAKLFSQNLSTWQVHSFIKIQELIMMINYQNLKTKWMLLFKRTNF